MAILPPGKVLRPLMMSEVAELWGWNYNTATSRIRRAFAAGLISRIQREGHQPYYLASQLEAVFGPPLNSGEAAPNRAYGARFNSERVA